MPLHSHAPQKPHGWQVVAGKLVKQYRFETFAQAMAFVNRVAALAEAQDHHPDIFISYNQVRLESLSHDVGQLTDRDFRLVEAIDELS